MGECERHFRLGLWGRLRRIRIATKPSRTIKTQLYIRWLGSDPCTAVEGQRLDFHRAGLEINGGVRFLTDELSRLGG